jgi:hypothetical protein
MDRSGKTVIPPQFDGAYEFSEGLAAVKVGDKYGFIDTAGKIVVPPQFDLVFSFSQDRAAVQVGTKFGFIDRTGLLVITPQFDDVNSFHGGRAAVKLAGGRNWGSDKKLGTTSTNRYGFIDKNGKYIGPPGLLFVQSDFGNEDGWMGDVTLVRTADDRIGIMDASGNITPVAAADEIGWDAFADGLAPVAIQGKWGYIDAAGKWVINPQFESTHGFTDGLAPVEAGGRWGLIDRAGKFVVNPQYDHVFGISEGYAIVVSGTGTIPECPKYCGYYGFIKTTGEPLGGVRIQERPNPDGSYSSPVRPFSEGLAAVKTDDGWGFIDITGKMAIEPQFEFAGGFRDGIAFVTALGKDAYITKTGAFVVNPFPGTTVKAMKERIATEAIQQFVGLWSTGDKTDFMVISREGKAAKIRYVAQYGLSPPPEIACTLAEGALIGDFYGHQRNFMVRMDGNGQVALTIDPYAEYAPIRGQQYFRRHNPGDVQRFANGAATAIAASDFASLLALMPKPPFVVTLDARGERQVITYDARTFAQRTAPLREQFQSIISALAAEGVQAGSVTFEGMTIEENDNATVLGGGFPVNIYILLGSPNGTYRIRLEDCIRSNDRYLPEQLKWYGKSE